MEPRIAVAYTLMVTISTSDVRETNAG